MVCQLQDCAASHAQQDGALGRMCSDVSFGCVHGEGVSQLQDRAVHDAGWCRQYCAVQAEQGKATASGGASNMHSGHWLQDCAEHHALALNRVVPPRHIS